MANVPTCYYPSGTSSPDTPCHSDDGASACCAHTDTCLSNGLCLAQGGSELISRGSCTDDSWQSPECPQYCADVHEGGGALIFLAGYIKEQFRFCCSEFYPSNNTCATATKESYAPFSLEAGHVIFNRTSGSTSTNIANAVTVTETATSTIHATATDIVTAAALTSPSESPSISSTSLSCSGREAAVGAGLGGSLGLALLVTIGLLWRQKKHKESWRTDAQTWERRWKELKTEDVAVSRAERGPILDLPARTPDELEGQPTSFPSEMAEN